ncbi:MAG: gliding motility-associated C-terminal domain-containing protein, partial [Cytophagaceae bacterium]|nr:gliding motility-associated C-terminal domain-containing protein [Cytophagaceae bacterium]
LFSNSVKRFVGIGAAAAVMLFTPYYFIKRAEEQPVANTSSPGQKSEAVETVAPVKAQQTEPIQEVMLEEQVQEHTEAVETVEEEVPVVAEEKVIEKTPIVRKTTTIVPAVKKKKKAKSYILEIPIDDPSAKGHQANSYAFSPAKGQTWKIPMHNYKEAKVTIFNKEGSEVFSSSIEQGKSTTWKGISTDGAKQKAGKYAYLLDFGNGKIEHGHVTINP